MCSHRTNSKRTNRAQGDVVQFFLHRTNRAQGKVEMVVSRTHKNRTRGKGIVVSSQKYKVSHRTKKRAQG